MKVLVVGRGGREHALVWKLAQSPRVEQLYCAPGNAGIGEMARLVPIDEMSIDELAAFAQAEKIDLTVVGPEAPLMAGIVERFQREDLLIFGPSKQAAMIEGSKAFAKDFMEKRGIPTARHETFSDLSRAVEYLEGTTYPAVIKADGLAAGKGVTVASSRHEAVAAVKALMQDGVFGEAGERVVIEEFLAGEEVTAMALVSGETVVPLQLAQDHKAVFDGDLGPNTGGMGAYSPVPWYDKETVDRVMREILIPAAKGMVETGTPFMGVLYAGLMITKDGPKVIEFNARFGDPETQVVVPRLESDLAEVLYLTASGRLNEVKLSWRADAAVCVVMASEGYPGKYQAGKVIQGLNAVRGDAVVFHAGTKVGGNGEILTAGGRVLGVTALAPSLAEAQERAYCAVRKITFTGSHYRTDIGAKALVRLRS